MPSTLPRLLPLTILAALLLWTPAPGKAQAAAPNAPPPLEFAPPPDQNPFKKPLTRSAPFFDLSEEAMHPPGAKPLPMTGLQSPNRTHAPRVSAPDASAPVPTRNSAARTQARTAPANSNAPDGRKAPSLSDMIGQMIMVGCNGFDLRDNDPLFASIQSGRAGNIVLHASGLPDGSRHAAAPGQVRLLTSRLQKTAPRPLFIAVTQEGGRVQALSPERGFEGAPAAAVLGRGGPDATRQTARRMGLEMAAMGINFDFAPVADLAVNPLNPAIGAMQRSFGADPRLAAAHAAAFGEGLVQAGVVPCLKHFPGRGSAREDRPDELPDISATWQPAELIPFQQAILAGWSGAVMPGHLYHRGLDALRPASLSARVLNGLLRGKMGFTGVVVSDDMRTGALARSYNLEERILFAVEAGVDIVLFSNTGPTPDVNADEVHAVLLRLAQQGRISPERIALSFERISRLKQRFAVWTP